MFNLKMIQSLPVLYADKHNQNCSVKGLRAFYLLTDKEDQVQMLDAWIKALVEAKRKITEVPKPTTKETIREILTIPEKQKEVAQTAKSIYMAINAEKRRTKTRHIDLIELHLRKHKSITQKDALDLYSCKNIQNVISRLRSKGMNIINRLQTDGLFKTRIYLYMGDTNGIDSQGN